MKSTQKMFLARLEEIANKIEERESDNLDSLMNELHTLMESIIDEDKETSTNTKYNFARERSIDVFAEGEDILLCKSRDEDRAAYIALQKENTIMPNAYKLEGFEDKLWEDMYDEKAFYTSIRRKNSDEYMGYCGIKNTQKNELELAIEILKEFQGKGYGKEALSLFMQQVKTVTGMGEFITLVDGENIASQKMCEACGGILSGIREHMLHDNEYMMRYEKENADQVTEVMRGTAKKFGVAPEKLLTHVLVYKFQLPSDESV